MNRPADTSLLKEIDKHLIYLEAALKSEPSEREIPTKLRIDLLREIEVTRRMIRKAQGENNA